MRFLKLGSFSRYIFCESIFFHNETFWNEWEKSSALLRNRLQNIQCRLNNWRHVFNVNWRAISTWPLIPKPDSVPPICVCDRSRWAFSWRRRYVNKKKKNKKQRVRSLFLFFLKKRDFYLLCVCRCDCYIYTCQFHIFLNLKIFLIERNYQR